MNLKDFLNKIKWKKYGKNVFIEIIHRGALKNRKLIPFESITEISKGHFCYGEDNTYIPFHRIQRILRNNKVIWKCEKPIKN